MDESPVKRSRPVQSTTQTLRRRFSLREDMAGEADVDRVVRSGVAMRGTNLWLLMFAIVIASVGLNVNSTAVVIGAMLISPLMGPIMGIGYGVGIDDLSLMRKGLSNLAFATLLSLIVSTAYFLLSPLTTAQTELLARTAPTIWDVLIALFGGLAGIVGATRRERSNVVPGVAIATALMPPLCTAGYGLASGNIAFFAGAFYLFTINCVFIAAAAAVGVRAMRLPQLSADNPHVGLRMHRYVIAIALLTIVPSIFLAYQMVKDEVFKSRATQFVHSQLEFRNSRVVETNIDTGRRNIEVTIVGDQVAAQALEQARARLPQAGLEDATLTVFQAGESGVDIAGLKTTLLADLYREGQATVARKEKEIEGLRAELSEMQARRSQLQGIPEELTALYPQILEVRLADANEWTKQAGWSGSPALVVDISATKSLSAKDTKRIEEWLRARLHVKSVWLFVDNNAARAHSNKGRGT